MISRAGIFVGTMDINVYAVLEGIADSHFDLPKQRRSQINKKELNDLRHLFENYFLDLILLSSNLYINEFRLQ